VGDLVPQCDGCGKDVKRDHVRCYCVCGCGRIGQVVGDGGHWDAITLRATSQNARNTAHRVTLPSQPSHAVRIRSVIDFDDCKRDVTHFVPCVVCIAQANQRGALVLGYTVAIVIDEPADRIAATILVTLQTCDLLG